MAYHRGSNASSGDDEQRWNCKVNFAVDLRRVSRADSSFVFFEKSSTFVLIKLSEKWSEATALHPFHDF
jgi:hypothetical protein